LWEANLYGLRIKFSTDEKYIYSQLTVPDHLYSWQNLIHGGTVAAILDEIMFWSAMYFCKKVVLTKKSTVEIKCPPFSKDMPVTAAGYIQSRVDKNNVTVGGAVYNSQLQLYATSIGDFAVIAPEIVDRLKILTEEDIKIVRKLIKSF
jgi:acyl-coenzyme A thioesterase PaaI-like protein